VPSHSVITSFDALADNANPKAEPEYKTEYRVGSFIMPNDYIRADTPLTRFTAPIEGRGTPPSKMLV